jgi:hypothetical protein
MKLTAESLIEEWKKDSEISDLNIAANIVETARLHNKYLEYYSIMKMAASKLEQDQEVMKKIIWLYYNGKLSQDEIDQWKLPHADPLNGLKILKSDMGQFLATDERWLKMNERVNRVNLILEILKEILDQIRWRNNSIKTLLDAKKFEAGY